MKQGKAWSKGKIAAAAAAALAFLAYLILAAPAQFLAAAR